MQKDVYSDLARSGVSRDVVDRYKISFLSSSQVSRMSGLDLGAGYIIPYYNMAGERIPESRLRILNPQQPKGMKYCALGDEHHIFFPLDWDEDDVLLITEGEKKSISAVCNGFSCVGIAGVDMWHDPSVTGQPRTPDKMIHRELMAALKHKNWREVIVVADSDAATNKRVDGAMKCLARAIRMQARIKAKYMAMPMLPEDKKCGIDDYLVENSPLALREALKNAMVPDNGWRYIIPYREQYGQTLKIFVPYYYGDEELFPPVIEEKIKKEKDKDTKEEKIVKYSAPVPTPALWYKKTYVVFHVQNNQAIEGNFDYPVREIDIVEGMTDSRRRTEFSLPDDKVADFVRNCGFGVKFSPISQELLAAQKRVETTESKTSYGVMATGWVNLRNHWYYILPGVTISEPGAPPCEFCQPGSTNAQDGYITSPKEKDALNAARDILRGSSGLCALVAFAFAGALITPIQQSGEAPEPSIVHLGGNSGGGKTSALRFIAGMAGSPAAPRVQGSLIKTWRATENGLEGPLERANDCFLMLDELGQAPENTDWSALLYLAANGTGKSRMSRTITTRRNLRWTCNILSTGEKSLLAQIKSSIPPEGLIFRVIDYEFNSETFYDKTENWTFTTAEKMSGKIDDALALINNHHGWVFRKFVEAYMEKDTREEVNKMFGDILQPLRAQMSGDETSAYSRRAKTIALIVTSAYLLDKVLGAGGDIVKNAGVFAKTQLWAAGMGDVTKSETALLGEEVCDYLATLPVADISIGKIPGVFVKDGHICVASAGILHVGKVLQMEKARVLQGLKTQFENKTVWIPGTGKPVRVWISNEPMVSETYAGTK
jgi:hypothetical protein